MGRSNVGKVTFGTTPISAYDYSLFRNYELFERLGSVLTASGNIETPEIMLNMCNVAGPDPLDNPAVAANREDKAENAKTWEYRSMDARRLRSSIAGATKAAVFASSDPGALEWQWDFSWLPGAPKLEWTDACLEFGIDPKGLQISAHTCNYSACWNWDKPGIGDLPWKGPESAVLGVSRSRNES